MQIVEQILDSREVAEMVGKRHTDLMRDIRRYIGQFNVSNLASVDFFLENTYADGKGESRPCYNVTKKGCEFIAHKLTGQKGTEFTAKYINRFHEMEEELKKTNHMDWFVNDIRVFQHREFGILRTLKLDGQDYFVGIDATRSLGYVNNTDTLKKRVSNPEKCYVGICDGNRCRKMVAITQKGLEELIRTGKLPIASKYNEWIQRVVIPTLRGTEIVPIQNGEVQTQVTPVQVNNQKFPQINNPLRMLKVLLQVADDSGIKVNSFAFGTVNSMLKDNHIGINTGITVEKACYELAWELAHVFIHRDGGDMIRSPLMKEYNEQATRAADMIIKMLNVKMNQM